MKKVVILLLFSLIGYSGFAAVWHVNYDTSIYADFDQLTTAVASQDVNDTDTLYVYGNLSTYNNVTINKSLTILGPGYFLDSNPGLQHSYLNAKVGTITLSAPGCLLSGIVITTQLNMNAANTVLIGCYLPNNTRINNTSNCLMQGCYFGPKTGYTSTTVDVNTSTNVIFSNCIFKWNNGFNSLNVGATSTATISNCIIRGNVSLNNSEIYNNIIVKESSYSLNWSASNSNIFNNVFVLINGFDWSTVITDLTNVLNYDGPLFVGGSSPDAQYELVDDTNNLALASGSLGDECGIFGGQVPYKLSGIPAIPSIYEINAPSVGNVLPIRVKARSNN